MAQNAGKLYICATPIGNLEDMTLRALRVLKEVDLIAAEDTRVTAKLLARYEIATRMTSYREHNEASKGKLLVEELKDGKSIALVSDAGMPGISDPGQRLIALCIAEGISIEPIPGPSALITALVISGLPTESFVFQGFLPRKKGERMHLLNELLGLGRTVVLYESPRRLVALLEEVTEIDEARPTVVARELTKKFEQVIRGSATEVLHELSGTEVKGEVVVLFGPGAARASEATGEELRREVEKMLAEGVNKKQAIAEVTKQFGVSKRLVYEAVIDIHEQRKISGRH